jgi:hypothetical protein
MCLRITKPEDVWEMEENSYTFLTSAQLHAPASLTLEKNCIAQNEEGSELVYSLPTARKPQFLSKLNRISHVKRIKCRQANH